MLLTGQNTPRTVALEGCETQGIYSAGHTDGDSTYGYRGILNPGANFIFPTVKKNQDTSKCDLRSPCSQ